MNRKYRIRRFVQHLRNEGTVSTSHAVVRHAKRGVKNFAEGRPGYYHLQFQLLCRKYDPEDITPIVVSPDDIQYLAGDYAHRDVGHLDYTPYFGPRETGWREVTYKMEDVPFGSVTGGDWDQPRPKFNRLILYRSLQQWVNDGTSWTNTDYYRGWFERFKKQGWSTDKARNLSMDRCQHIEKMYNRIQSEGYLSQRELQGHPLQEVTVAVGRDGELFYNSEGRHRLSIAKVLDLNEIPALVLVKHKNYSDRKQHIISNAR